MMKEKIRVAAAKRRILDALPVKTRVLIPAAVLALFSSCTGFFSTSLASWAQRDPASLVPAVTAGNVNGLIDDAAGDPSLSLAILNRIRESAATALGAEKTVLQAASLRAAVNAAAPARAVLNHIDENTEVNSGNAAGLFNLVIADLKNLPQTAGALREILPAVFVPGNSEFDAFIGASDPYYLAMAATVLFADDAARSGNIAAYVNGYAAPGASPLAEALAQAAMDRGGDSLGIMGDFLDNLNLSN
ncbi:MAG: hypothetical protein LBL44_00345 [Treponema sp.]|jgi:hypothetical protein|nr:hypothetical protein [Treponema sp.]